MIVYTLWRNGDLNDLPWLVDAVDEYTVEDWGDFPPDYLKKKNDPNVRELAINIPEDAVRDLFEPPPVEGEIVNDSNSARIKGE